MLRLLVSSLLDCCLAIACVQSFRRPYKKMSSYYDVLHTGEGRDLWLAFAEAVKCVVNGMTFKYHSAFSHVNVRGTQSAKCRITKQQRNIILNNNKWTVLIKHKDIEFLRWWSVLPWTATGEGTVAASHSRTITLPVVFTQLSSLRDWPMAVALRHIRICPHTNSRYYSVPSRTHQWAKVQVCYWGTRYLETLQIACP